MPYKSLWIFLKVLLLKTARFLSHLVLGVYVENPYILIMYNKKGYCELLVSLSMLFVHIFVHTR